MPDCEQRNSSIEMESLQEKTEQCCDSDNKQCDKEVCHSCTKIASCHKNVNVLIVNYRYETSTSLSEYDIFPPRPKRMAAPISIRALYIANPSVALPGKSKPFERKAG